MSKGPFEHSDKRVRDALVALSDALTTWGRVTNLRSAIIFQDETGFSVRLYDGRPIPEHVTDAELLDMIQMEPPPGP